MQLMLSTVVRNCLQICCLWIGDHNCDWEWRDSTISESQSILALAMHCRAVFVRDVQCRHVTSLVAISVRVAVAIPSQPWRSRWVIHTFSSTPCQSIPDSQSHSGIPLSTTDHQPSYRGWPGIVRVTLTVRDTLTIGTWVCIFVTVLALAWIVRVTMDFSDKLWFDMPTLDMCGIRPSWLKHQLSFPASTYARAYTCYEYVYMYICMYVIMYVCMYVRMFVCTCVCIYVRLYVHLCTCTYARVYTCTY